jgi:hypothetical protein
VTDDGPRSESRSSGGWQGGPSGDDIEGLPRILDGGDGPDVRWAEWRRKGNGTDGDHELIGDLEWHENAIRDYDHVLTVLAEARTTRAEPPGLDVERLARACHATDQDAGGCHHLDDEALVIDHLQYAVAIAAEYVRLAAPTEDGT